MLLSLLALSASTLAVAQDEGVYVGFGLGKLTERPTSQVGPQSGGGCGNAGGALSLPNSDTVFGVTATGSSCSFDDQVQKFFLGYRLNRNLALEGSYGSKWGSARTTLNGFKGGIDPNMPRGAISVSGEETRSSLGAAALGILPVGSRLEPFLKAGISWTTKTLEISGASTRSESKAEAHVGAGVILKIYGGLAARAELEHFASNNFSAFTLGAQYGF